MMSGYADDKVTGDSGEEIASYMGQDLVDDTQSQRQKD